jgi:transcriptional regulator with XRE-family HTH domain
MTIAERIDQRMAEKGQGLRPASIEIGCAIDTLKDWRKGNHLPSPGKIASLARYLGEPEKQLREEILRELGYLAPEERLVATPLRRPARAIEKTTPLRAKKEEVPSRQGDLLRRRLQLVNFGPKVAA